MKRILVALDGSARAQAVFDAARELARWMDAKLVLVQAVGVPVELPVEAYKVAPATLAEVLERDARTRLAELAARHPDFVDATLVGVGTPWRVVCEEAKKQKADIVVIGAHGYGAIDRLLGTTAGRIVNHCEVSVMVVRPRE